MTNSKHIKDLYPEVEKHPADPEVEKPPAVDIWMGGAIIVIGLSGFLWLLWWIWDALGTRGTGFLFLALFLAFGLLVFALRVLRGLLEFLSDLFGGRI